MTNSEYATMADCVPRAPTNTGEITRPIREVLTDTDTQLTWALTAASKTLQFLSGGHQNNMNDASCNCMQEHMIMINTKSAVLSTMLKEITQILGVE